MELTRVKNVPPGEPEAILKFPDKQRSLEGRRCEECLLTAGDVIIDVMAQSHIIS